MNNQQILKDYLRMCKADGLKEITIITAERTLRKFVEWCGETDLNELKTENVYDYLDFIDTYFFVKKGKKIKYSPGTKNRIRMILKKFLRHINPGLGAVIKLRSLKDGKIPEDILTRDEIEKLIDACLTTRDRAIIAMFYESGARKGELLSVQVKHLTFDENGCILNIQKGKTGSRRIRLVLASSYLRQWVDTHPLKGDPDAFLICSNNSPHGVITATGLADQLHAIAKRAGVSQKRVYCHAFRHSRATHLAECLTEQQLKEYLGWTRSSNMASVYVHLSGRDMDQAILKMHGIVKEESVKGSLTVGRCPRCKELNPETSLYCGKCGLPLTETSAQKMTQINTTLDLEFLESSTIDPALLKLLAKELKGIMDKGGN